MPQVSAPVAAPLVDPAAGSRHRSFSFTVPAGGRSVFHVSVTTMRWVQLVAATAVQLAGLHRRDTHHLLSGFAPGDVIVIAAGPDEGHLRVLEQVVTSWAVAARSGPPLAAGDEVSVSAVGHGCRAAVLEQRRHGLTGQVVARVQVSSWTAARLAGRMLTAAELAAAFLGVQEPEATVGAGAEPDGLPAVEGTHTGGALPHAAVDQEHPDQPAFGQQGPDGADGHGARTAAPGQDPSTAWTAPTVPSWVDLDALVPTQPARPADARLARYVPAQPRGRALDVTV